MDPVITLANVNDKGLPLSERIEAAIDLLRWLKGGGFVPGGDLDAVIADVERVLAAGLVGCRDIVAAVRNAQSVPQ